MGDSADAEATVREFLTRFAGRSDDDAAALLTEEGRDALVEAFPEGFRRGESEPAKLLELFRRGLQSQYGAFDGIDDPTVDGDEATVRLAFAGGSETATVGVDGGITSFSFDPAYEPPEYADESAFEERDVTVDAGDVDLDGLLTVPDGSGPFPAALLVHGAGLHDPDGTDANAKVLKDLAWGLASEGIASLRYQKRLAEHEVDDENYTVDGVVVDDAVAAVRKLAAAEAVDESAVFVAGHSQGGMCAPRIADRHGGVAGVVVLDSLADPVPDPENLVFLRYEFDTEGELDEEGEAMLAEERETVRRIAAGEYDDEETLWGRPGTWHRSVAEYDPAATASELDAPVFVVKGSRADPETQADLLAWHREEVENWRNVDLPGGSRVEFYPGIDHFLQRGGRPADPMGLYFGGNVDEDVVSDVVEWIDGVACLAGAQE